MAIIYEINPPRLAQDESRVRDLLDTMMTRVSRMLPVCDGLHVTDAVLGTARIGALESCKEIKEHAPDAAITMSLRTRDHTFEEIAQIIRDGARAGICGILLVRGDPPQQQTSRESDLYPSGVLARLRKEDLTCGMDMLLSLRADPNWERITKKIAARPDAFVTQVISSVQQAQRMVDELRRHDMRVMPCVMLPSEKNARSASVLDLDWSEYEQSADKFVRDIERVAGSVLVTSPSDIATAERILSMLHQHDAQ